MPTSVSSELESAVALCIDDELDVLECGKSFLEIFSINSALLWRWSAPA
jgi:hypothetical protein